MLDQYIQMYGKRLYGLCLHLCAERADAEDLYQETWLKALKNLSKYDREQKFEPWITSICVNTYRNILRRRRRSPFYDGFASGEEKDSLLNNLAAAQVLKVPEGTVKSRLNQARKQLKGALDDNG